jgi:hypothetical protein
VNATHNKHKQNDESWANAVFLITSRATTCMLCVLIMCNQTRPRAPTPVTTVSWKSYVREPNEIGPCSQSYVRALGQRDSAHAVIVRVGGTEMDRIWTRREGELVKWWWVGPVGRARAVFKTAIIGIIRPYVQPLPANVQPHRVIKTTGRER